MLEVVLSASLLGGVFILFSSVLLSALRGTAAASNTVELIAEANRQLYRLEAMSREESWSQLLAQDGERRQSGEFEVEISVREVSLSTPSSSAEQPFRFLGTDRRLDGLIAHAEVRVVRGVISTVQSRLLGRPTRELDDPPIVFRGMPTAPLAPDGEVTVTASLVDVDGNEVPALFDFSLVPLTGNGTLEVSRNGREVTFTNVYQNNGVATYPGGACRLKATTTYFGRKYIGESTQLELGS